MYYAVILAGEQEKRLENASRRERPGWAQKAAGKRSLFQNTVERLAPQFPADRIYVVTPAGQSARLIGQAPNIPAANFLIEPEGRGTAAAIGLAAIHLRQHDPYAVMAVLTADHTIANLEVFHRALEAAAGLAREGFLVTLGIRPDGPATGFGYIQQGERLGDVGSLEAFRVERFVEKPDADTARRMAAGGYTWNSGMFVWHVNSILEEFERQMPDLSAQLEGLASYLDSSSYGDALRQTWTKVARQSVDYGIMENAQDAAVIPVDLGWADVGSWVNLFELLPADARGNALVGPTPYY